MTQSTSTSITSNTPNNARFDNFFTLFNQPVQFEINEDNLDTRLRQLQKQYHPDNMTAADKAQQQAQQTQLQDNTTTSTSALINHAYQTLKQPDLRAAYLLEMVGQAQKLDDSIADLQFLEDAMELRMDLDDAINEQNSEALKLLQPQILSRLQQQAQQFNHTYQTQTWQSACDAAQKLKFLVKLNADVESGLDKVATQTDNDQDDDLYV